MRSNNAWFTLCAMMLACGGGQSGPRPASVAATAGAGGAGATTSTATGGDATRAGTAGRSGSAGSGSAPGSPSSGSTDDTTLDGSVLAHDPHLRFYGRWDRRDAAHPVASWGPVAIRLRFESSSVMLDLSDEASDLPATKRSPANWRDW